MRTVRLSSDIDRVFRRGRRGGHPLVVAAALEHGADQPTPGRVAFVAGRKVGGAVVRNRAKRVLRESCRRAGGPWPGFDVVLVARPQTAIAAPQDVDHGLAVALRSAGVGSP